MARPKNKEGTVKIPVTAAIRPGLDQLLIDIASAEDRSKSHVIEKILVRGLLAYHRDGLLEEDVKDIEVFHAMMGTEALPRPKVRLLIKPHNRKEKN